VAITQLEKEKEKFISRLHILQEDIKEKAELIKIQITKLKESDSKMSNMQAEIKSAQQQVSDERKHHTSAATDVEKIKEKFRREVEVWAKEKRRLESKIRHMNKSNSSTISTHSSSQQTAESADVSVVFKLL